jgi:alkaline phosphatase D
VRQPSQIIHSLFIIAAITIASPAPAADAPLTRIAFGSCARENRPQPIWDTIVAGKPQLFLMIGDNIYGDSEDMNVLKAKWAMLGAQPGFAKLRAMCPVLATWDDHDYGVNDGGAEYPRKVESQQVFLDFFQEPADSPRRKRAGIYDAKTFGPEGKRVQVILLDTRYHRSALKPRPGGKPPGKGPYMPDDDAAATVLGDEQWRWLEAELRKPAQVRIIASSIQFVPEEHGWEMWANHPRQRQQMCDVIAKTKAGGVIFISGDRHKSEISRLAPADSGVSYPVYDVTSSSLNQPSGGSLVEANRHRVAGYPDINGMYGQVNYGTIEIDWEADDPRVVMAVRSLEGEAVIEHATGLSAIQPSAE